MQLEMKSHEPVSFLSGFARGFGSAIIPTLIGLRLRYESMFQTEVRVYQGAELS
jgi:hypothetical protein